MFRMIFPDKWFDYSNTLTYNELWSHLNHTSLISEYVVEENFNYGRSESHKVRTFKMSRVHQIFVTIRIFRYTHTHTHYNIVCSFNWVHFHHIDEIILNLTFVVKLNAANVSEWMSWMIWVNECECVLKMEYLCETLHKIVTIHSKHWIIFHNNATRCEQSVCTMSDTHIHTVYLILAWIRGYSYTHCRILSE